MTEISMAENTAFVPVPRPAADAAQALSRRSTGLIEFSLAAGSFGVGTGEFAIMGLLPEVAAGLDVTTPEAGHVISAYALGVVVGAPAIAVMAARMTRRRLLLMLMAIFAAGNALSAVAPDYASLILFRFLSGVPHGAYFGVAALVAASMAERHKRTQAVGRVMLGLTLATLVGSPFATWAGQAFGWRSMFVIVGAIGLATIGLLAAVLPQDKVRDGASALRELGALRRRQVWLTLGMAAVGFGGMFSVFTYIASTAVNVAGMPLEWAPLIMTVFGAGMVGGNLVGAWMADRTLMGTIGGMMTFSILVLSVFALTAASPVMLLLCVFLIGFGVAVGPALQTRLMDVAGDAQTLAAALNHSAFNIANALGAWLGGLAIAGGYGFASTGWVGAVLGAGGLGIFALSLAEERRSRRADAERDRRPLAA